MGGALVVDKWWLVDADRYFPCLGVRSVAMRSGEKRSLLLQRNSGVWGGDGGRVRGLGLSVAAAVESPSRGASEFLLCGWHKYGDGVALFRCGGGFVVTWVV